jgi:hypothetical protein
MAERFGVDIEKLMQQQGRLEVNPHGTDFLIPSAWKEFWHIDGVPNPLNVSTNSITLLSKSGAKGNTNSLFS